MKNRILFLLLLLPLGAFCQNENLARLSIVGAVSELGISPSEEIWIATKAGNVYYTKQIGDLWHLGDFGGVMLTTNSIQFGEAIKEITGGRLFGNTVADKNYAIFKIADYLYRIKLQAMN
jgi:hypothetical protein